jgi:hypothetical protein
MTSTEASRWIRASLFAGLAYAVIGVTFGLPTTHARAWRLAAWLASGLVFLAHIGHEHFRFRHRPLTVAWHAALAVAVGGFGLAVAGAAHALYVSSFGPLWFIALIAWPAVTAMPAFVAAFVVGAALSKMAPLRGPEGEGH